MHDSSTGGVLWSVSTIPAVTSIFANKAVPANKADIDYCTLPVEGTSLIIYYLLLFII